MIPRKFNQADVNATAIRLVNTIQEITMYLNHGIIKTLSCYEDEVIPEILGLTCTYINFNNIRIPVSKHIREYFDSKKFVLYNVIDIDELYCGKYDDKKLNLFVNENTSKISYFVSKSTEIDIFKLLTLGKESFNYDRVATMVVREWYMKLIHKKEKPTYFMKKYEVEELATKIKDYYISLDLYYDENK